VQCLPSEAMPARYMPSTRVSICLSIWLSDTSRCSSETAKC